MSDGYMVVRASDHDGTYYGDPLVFDTKAEAIDVASQWQPPEGYTWELYRLEYLQTVDVTAKEPQEP